MSSPLARPTAALLAWRCYPRATLRGRLSGQAGVYAVDRVSLSRTPVNSLPPLERDTTLESVDSYTQGDLKISPTQTATISFAVFPQKFQYMGLNTFTPQPATADLHQRGYQVYGQNRFLTGDESALISQFSYKTYDADVTAQSDDPYQLLIETTEGGYFNRQARRAWRLEGQESYQFAPRHFLGTHDFKAGLNYAHSSYDGQQTFLPVELIGVPGCLSSASPSRLPLLSESIRTKPRGSRAISGLLRSA